MKLKALISWAYSFEDCYIVDFLQNRDLAYSEPIAICVLKSGQIVATSISNLTVDYKDLVLGDD